MSINKRLSRRNFVTAAATVVGASLMPRITVRAAAQDPVIDTLRAKAAPEGQGRRNRGVKVAGRERVVWEVEPFPMEQVRLLDGPFKQAMEVNNKWLLSLPSDRLLHTFRLTSGIASQAEPLGGWEKPDCELRGHFAGGHVLSALALSYDSTGDDEIKARGNELVSELAKCQEKNQDGFLSAFPVEEFDRLREERRVWAPYYTYHKIMAGHLDMYLYCGNDQALQVAENMAGWVGHWSESISDDKMQRILQTEFGGMNEALCNLYAVTGKGQYMHLASRFEKNIFFDPLADHRDELKGIHANTHIPQAISAARRYELTGDRRYHEIAAFFWNTVTTDRAYCTGGTSNEEFWRTDPGKLASELGEYTEECCCAYNMLKLTRHVFGWTRDPRAMDYYERVLWNHRLGTQDDEGLKSYFLPLGSGYWKYYNSSLDSFWCCTGTGAEEFAKFADSIYFHDDRGVYVNLFIASELNWPDKGIKLRQETRFPEQEGTSITVRAAKPVEMAVNLRVPYWATRGGSLKINGEAVPVFASPSSYLMVTRTWKDGDRIDLSLPMSLHIHAMPDDPTLQAMMYGPLVLAGRLGDQGLDHAIQHPGYDTAPTGQPIPVPAIASSAKDPVGWVEPASGAALTFNTTGQAAPTALVPLYRVSGQRYAVYWKTTAS